MRVLLSVFFLCLGLLFGAPHLAAAANAPTCFVYVKVLPSGEVTIVENMKGFGPALERSLDAVSRPYASHSPFVQEAPLDVVGVKVDGKPVQPTISAVTQNGVT
ncbi:MAG: hypothetical protein IKL01_05695, partial [Mailhella sp.]|nr:hypothetical protein [Mailhella sp.]